MRKSILVFILYSLFLIPIQANSPYLSKVWEYVPAPGQFVHIYPGYEEGDDAATMSQKAEALIANNAEGLISLGAWGGYVIFSFDHPVVNVKDANDFIVEGNAFDGSAEPGIVMVSKDVNGNGKPDDPWYELAGSEYSNPQTIHNYKVTYERPAANHKATPDPVAKYRIDTTFVKWTDNKGKSGYIVQISFHTQPYYPEWISADKMTFTGARLPDNAEWTGAKYILHSYDYGYVDNYPNDNTAAQLDIDRAVDANGKPVYLNMIHFVKVYNGLLQQCGTIGETSTEISGAKDLHPNAPLDIDKIYDSQQPDKQIINGQIYIIRNNMIYNPLGFLMNNY